eukprot:gene8999-9744_t
MSWDEEEILEQMNETTLRSRSWETISSKFSIGPEEPFSPLTETNMMDLFVFALNSADTVIMKDILQGICAPWMLIRFYCYVKQVDAGSRTAHQDTFSSLPPMHGLDSFVDYWMKVHDTTPDCVMTLKTPVRLCHRSKGECAYIFGVELVGTMLAWIDMPYPLTFQSNHFQPLSQQHKSLMGRRAVVASIEKRGSVIMYVNERDQVIDRLDFYLDY